ncbi:carbon starvation protein A [Candidatus Woesearchaeota archaeon]|nr:carbon starvation protein A [Candidatus Woesearchaeota archaeon]
MNSVWILLLVCLWLFLGYRFYGRYLEKQIKPDDKKKTPAVRYKDDIDFSPARKPFLLGHHFASIAGAGPIIGPILAISYFGWLPVVLWVSLGSVLIGAVHDYTILMASVRYKAKNISNIAKDFLNTKSGFTFGIMIWFTVVLIITVFSVSAADSIIQKPELVIPLIAITLISIIVGFGVNKFGWDYKLTSLIALILIFIFAWIGNNFPLSLPISDPVMLKNIWVTIIILYAGVASVVPIWLLLRPRDYLSALQMSLILFLGFLAIIIVRPIISAPHYIHSDIFPIWPILFITVACGAVSGFHGLISSGTTSKQLSKESDAKPIGYGSMLMEGLLAVFVTIVVISGVNWGVQTGGFSDLLKKGWIVLFSTGYGNIVGSMGLPILTGSLAAVLGAFMVNQFILTTVDSSSRIGRFVLSENLFPKLKNRYLTTLITIVPAWLIAITQSYESLWRLFGSSNQLIASISMITVSSFFLTKKRNVKFIVIPALFVLVTTLSALVYLIFSSNGYFAQENYMLVIISALLFILGVVVAFEGFQKLKKM